ncbi:IS3 family transposase [Bacillus nitroreducens]
MSKRARSLEEKFKVIKALENGTHSLAELESIYNVQHTSIYDWIYKYEKYGIEGLKESSSWRKYSKELKLKAVKDYLSGDYSLREVTRKYEIPSDSTLRQWLKKYNGHRELNDTGKRRSGSMTKGRKTTWKERIEIVQDALANEKNYHQTAEDHKVSYQQIYQWVRKYEAGGWDALKDRRGRTKSEEELTSEEKMKLEMRRIEKENERLRAEKCFLKKVRGDRKEAKINQVRYEDKYVAIKELYENENLSIVLLCDIAGVSRAGYYKWLKRQPSTRELENIKIVKEMKNLHKKVEGIYGYRRMTLNINRLFNHKYNHKRIFRLMNITGIQSVIRRKRPQYQRSTPQHITDNVLNREFTAEKPNEKWVTDVTEFKYGSSRKAYLSAILDLYDGSIISYVLGHSNNNKLVFKTLDEALGQLNGEHPLIHSDRGFQYTSHGFKRRLDQTGMTHSMSRVGKCIDNGPMESFWGTLKCEKYYLHRYETFEDLSKAIDEYIYFYNYERYQERLNGLSPVEYRAKAA